MGRLREIPRTAAFAWSADITKPSIATGTRAGAVDIDFSGETKLEIWDLDLGNGRLDADVQPLASLNTDSRFYDIAWGSPSSDHSDGLIAGALENGSLDIWDASKLKSTPKEALMSRITKHSGAIKALQFNPHRPELLASSGAKGELFITNLNDVDNPYRLGAAAARADDIDALDWNKTVPHIMATAGSGGFVTVWDVKARKEILTLNNYGRKSVSAVAWDPDEPRKLATAVSSDQDPLILMWDLRNSSAPERILTGHEQGILSLSWSAYDTDLLLSCGKDNRNICWNPRTGEALGEFPIVTNWTFETRWNPRHPTLLATASFDGKILVQSIQSTNGPAGKATTGGAQTTDGADFFANAQIQPQASSFSLVKPPQWLRRPIGASFGFGGKLVRFSTKEDKSTVQISTFASDSSVDSAISSFQVALKSNDLSKLCETKVSEAKTETNKNDWKIIQTLVSETPRTGLLSYLGFSDFHLHPEDGTHALEVQDNDFAKPLPAQTNGVKDNSHKRLSSFFDSSGTTNQDFLADLAASKGGRTNNPFEIYTGSESEADTEITRAIILGSFAEAMDICLKENRMSEAFMIAICGGQKCIDKAQAAYFAQSSNGPNYLRLLGSVVGKNLWDVVYNANLDHWADVMATLCTYADENEFPDLCEALGDRLEEFSPDGKDATFCYLAGSKLEKLIPIWIREMQNVEHSRSESAKDESAFSIHVEALQNLIEKVSIFRKVTRYEDKDAQESTSTWRLGALYKMYAEYADVVAAYGHLELADEYLALLPSQYPAADVARNRVQQATQKTGGSTKSQSAARIQPAARAQLGARLPPVAAALPIAQPAYNIGAGHTGIPTPAAPATVPASIPARLAPAGYQNSYTTAPSPYAPTASSSYAPTTPFGNQYQPSNPSIIPPEPTQPQPSGPPPSRALNGASWNDLPESFTPKPPNSRRGTPGPGVASAIKSPFSHLPEATPAPPPMGGRAHPPLPPPPKAGSPRPLGANALTQQLNPVAAPTTSTYLPPVTMQTLPPPQQSMPRGPSPYNPPPAAAAASGSNRYAPAPGTPATSGPNAGPPPGGRVIAPNPYANPNSGQSAMPLKSSQQPNFAQPPPPRAAPPVTAPPPPRTSQYQGAPQAQPVPSVGPPPSARMSASSSVVAQHPGPSAPTTQFYPAGDRSHIPAESLPIYEKLNVEFQRIKGLAPASFKQHVDDTEKRLNLLFDALNNQTLAAGIIAQLLNFTAAFSARDFDQALEIHAEILKIVEQSPPWMVGLKRFLSMSKVTPI